MSDVLWTVYDGADDELLSIHSSEEVAEQAVKVYYAHLTVKRSRKAETFAHRFEIRGPYSLNQLSMPL